MNSFKVVIAGGGTGGHFFSGMAIAEDILLKHPHAEIIFVGTERGIEARTPLLDSRMKLKLVRAKGFKGLSFIKKINALIQLVLGWLESFIFLIQTKPLLVVGVGGYASLPTLLAAFFLKPFLGSQVMVIEQNSSPGLSNQILVRLGVKGFCPFKVKYFNLAKLPLRKKMKEASLSVKNFQWPPKKILIMGGSQGAKGLNQAWTAMLPKLKDAYPGWSYFHQCGTAHLDTVKLVYEELQLSADVFAFSHEMEKYFLEADLIIARSGALSIFELIAFKRPVIFIPFPFAADDHQTTNAHAVQKREWIVKENELNFERFQKIISEKPSLLQSPTEETLPIL